LVLNVAVPVVSRTPLPNTVEPYLNVTVPVGVPALELTTAVNVTVCPTVEGFGDELNVMTVAVLLTTWINDPELEARVASPG
jgi:hypothetical protein